MRAVTRRLARGLLPALMGVALASCEKGVNEVIFIDSNVTANYGCVPIGFPCVADAECETNLCFGNICSIACTLESGCPRGFACMSPRGRYIIDPYTGRCDTDEFGACLENPGVCMELCDLSLIPDPDAYYAAQDIEDEYDPCDYVDCAGETHETPAEWECPGAWYGDGLCDCGCGAEDARGDCLVGECGGLPTSEGPPTGWTCLASWWNDGVCDNNCGVPDHPDDCLGAPGDWTCPVEWWGDGECDIGCTPLDVDCGGAPQQGGSAPPEWTCAVEYYFAFDGCDCNCGAYDPDCDDPAAVIYGCGEGQGCTAQGTCAPLPFSARQAQDADGEEGDNAGGGDFRLKPICEQQLSVAQLLENKRDSLTNCLPGLRCQALDPNLPEATVCLPPGKGTPGAACVPDPLPLEQCPADLPGESDPSTGAPSLACPSRQCLSQLCLTPAAGFYGGYCASECAPASGTCAEGSSCLVFNEADCGQVPCYSDFDCEAELGGGTCIVLDETGLGYCSALDPADGDFACVPYEDSAGNPYTLVDGICLRDCVADADCLDAPETNDVNYQRAEGDYTCERGMCLPHVPALGEACVLSEDCGNPFISFCVPDDGSGYFPGGYCSAICTPRGGCPNGGVCSEAFYSFSGNDPAARYCMAACASDADCRAGYFCTADGSCMAEPYLPFVRERVGEACAGNFECQSNVCMDESTYPMFPGGYCSQSCSEDLPCPTGTLCSSAVAMLFGGQPTCMSGCSNDGDCRSGYFCSVEGTCLPAQIFGPSDVAPGEARIGAPCIGDGDCQSGLCFREADLSGFVGGFCTGYCEDDNDCPGFSSLCDPVFKICSNLCDFALCEGCDINDPEATVDERNNCRFCLQLSCRAFDTPEQGNGAYLCSANNTCLPTALAFAANGGEPPGGPCRENSQCATGLCITEGDPAAPGFVGGYCSAKCNPNQNLGSGVNPGCPFFGSQCDSLVNHCTEFCVPEAQCIAEYVASGYTAEEVAPYCVENCRPGYRCSDTYSCLPEVYVIGPPDGALVGTVCTGDQDCAGSFCIREVDYAEFVGGYCSFACASNADCPTGSACDSYLGGCAPTCTTGADCRTGYDCSPLSRTCIPVAYVADIGNIPQGWCCDAAWYGDGLCDCGCGAADSTDDCGALPPYGAGGACEAYGIGDYCVGSGTDPVGAPSVDGSNCQSGVYFGGQYGYPNGYCTAWCTGDGDCGTGARCSPLDTDGYGLCYDDCTVIGDCRTGYLCQTPTGFSGDVCVPDPAAAPPPEWCCDASWYGDAYCDCGCGAPDDLDCADSYGAGGACEGVGLTSSPYCAGGGGGTDPVGAASLDCSNCVSGLCYQAGANLAYPGGYCTAACTQDSDCGGGNNCDTYLGECQVACADNTPCRTGEGYECELQLDGVGSGCRAGLEIGEAVIDDCDACETGVCFQNSGGVFPGGYCSQVCTGDGDCPAGSLCDTAYAGGVCLVQCVDNTPCRVGEGYTCQTHADTVDMGCLP